MQYTVELGKNKMITGVRLPTCRGQLFGAVDLGECIYHEETVLWEKLKKVVLLNAVVTRSDKPAIIVTMPASVDDVKALVKIAERVESYIGHDSTAKLLSKVLGIDVAVNRAMYTPEMGDIAVVVKLKKRLEKPEDIKNVRAEDVEFLVVNYVVC
jgi:hypothetical protein